LLIRTDTIVDLSSRRHGSPRQTSCRHIFINQNRMRSSFVLH